MNVDFLESPVPLALLPASTPKLRFQRRGAEKDRELRRGYFADLPLLLSLFTSAPPRLTPLFYHFSEI
jgi:hypothetical protein